MITATCVKYIVPVLMENTIKTETCDWFQNYVYLVK